MKPANKEIAAQQSGLMQTPPASNTQKSWIKRRQKFVNFEPHRKGRKKTPQVPEARTIKWSLQALESQGDIGPGHGCWWRTHKQHTKCGTQVCSPETLPLAGPRRNCLLREEKTGKSLPMVQGNGQEMCQGPGHRRKNVPCVKLKSQD